MIKVFLVEDEVVVREGIKNNIPWKEHGYEFIGEASDGELAYPMIEKLKPDVVITDIKMPFMDGLALSSLIKGSFPWMEIIILSGFEEFDYAKEAIKIGVAEYLTKPISSEELLKVLDKISAKINEKKLDRILKEKYEKEMQENSLTDGRELFSDMVTGRKSTEELLKAASSLGIELSGLYYNIILFRIQSSNHPQEEYSGSAVHVSDMIMNVMDKNGVVVFDRNLEGKALLIKADCEEGIRIKQNTIISSIREILKNYPQINYFGGIGKIVQRLHDIPASFETASKAFAHRYMVNQSAILDGEELGKQQYISRDDFNIGDINVNILDKQHIMQFLKTGNKDEVMYFVDEFYREIGENALKSIMFRQYIAMDIYFAVAGFLESLNAPKDYIVPMEFKLDLVGTENLTRDYIVEILNKALSYRDSVASNRYKDVVDEAIAYIRENFADEDLSLNRLASKVNVSPNHLSMIFAQQTGAPFIKYLTDLRMDTAKELLKCTNKRSSEIAQEVGYKDPHYFSFIFKKTQGMTPTQYREAKET